jgi:hypothetical protein
MASTDDATTMVVETTRDIPMLFDLSASAVTDGDTVTGITVSIRARSNKASVNSDTTIELLVGGVVQGSAQRQSLTSSWASYTGINDAAWDSDWTAAQMAGMQIQLASIQGGMPTADVWEVSTIDVIVTFTPEERTATGAQNLPAVTQQGTIEEAMVASGDQDLPATTQQGSVTQVEIATISGAQDLPAVTQQGIAEEVIVASSDQDLSAVTQQGTAEEAIVTTGEQDLPAVTQQGSITHIQSFTSTGTQDLPAVTQQGIAEETIIALGDQDLLAVIQQGSVTHIENLSGTGDQDLPATTQQGIAEETIVSSSAQDLLAVTQQGTVKEIIVSSGDQDLPTVTQQGTTEEIIVSSGDQDLLAVTQQGSIEEIIISSGDQDLAVITQQGSLIHIETVSGSSSQDLATIIQQGSLIHLESISITGNQDLGTIIQQGSVEEIIVSSGTQDLAIVTQQGSVEEIIVSSGDQNLPAIIQQGLAKETISLSGDQDLSVIIQQGSAEEIVIFSGSQDLATMTQQGSVTQVENLLGTGSQLISGITQQGSLTLTGGIVTGTSSQIFASILQSGDLTRATTPDEEPITLFGLDVAQILADEIATAGDLQSGILTKMYPGTRTPGDLTGGTNPVPTSHTLRGIVSTGEQRREDQVGADTVSEILILGRSVSPFVRPEINDEVTLDGETYVLTKLLESDPARAAYQFEAKASSIGTPPNSLFGLNIAVILADEIAAAGNLQSGTLVKTSPGTRTPGNLTGGTNPDTVPYTIQGVVSAGEQRREGQVGADVVSEIMILGATLNPVGVPEVNDEVTLDSKVYILTKLIARDPAGAAYQFEAQASSLGTPPDSLFGLDIAGILADELAAAGNVRQGTLIKTSPGTRTPGDLTSGTNPGAISYSFWGLAERRAKRRDGQVGASRMPVVTLLGDTIKPVAIPEVNDTVVLDSEIYTLVRLLARDPVGATYEFEAEAK